MGLFIVTIVIIVILVTCVSKVNEKNQLKLIIEAADRGNENAKADLMQMFANGFTAEEHNRIRREIYLPKAQQGDSFAEYYMGLLCQDNKESLEWWIKAANHGNLKAMNAVAMGYSEHANEPEQKEISLNWWAWGYDAKEEKRWRLKAANTGDAESQLNMGNYYSWNTEDIDSAINWYEKAIVSSMNTRNLEVLFAVYKGLSSIYDIRNVERQKEILIKMLNFMQEYGEVYIEDYKAEYSSAAFSLGLILELNESDKRKAAYCYVISYCTGKELAAERLCKLSYSVLPWEYEQWNNDAKCLRFCMPS